tara:strand:- start:298 stop:1140 length:843 start_codon:yes stop_codon:yes gene_type:complete
MKYTLIFFVINSCLVLSQNLNLYFTLVQKGRLDEVRENLPDLVSRYPNNPGVFYLQALVNKNGESSLLQYQELIKNYSDSEYAALSSMKIGEYLFARGLYSQASTQLKKSILGYQKGEHHQRALDLMVNSYIATGEEDSVQFSLDLISKLYPSLDYKKYGFFKENTAKRDPKLVRVNKETITERIKTVKAKRSKSKSKKQIKKPWVVQVGAFGNYNNANSLKNQLKNGGYPTEVRRINSNGKRLHAVRIVRYSSKSEAEKIGRSLKSKFGLDFRVINSPK